MPIALIIFFLFVLGASIGSFLNVVVWRLPRDMSLISPGSHCPRCRTPLAWRDNIPVLGWLLLGGKCRYCRSAISARYPIIEFLTGVIFVLTYLLLFHFQLGPAVPGSETVNRFGEVMRVAGGLELGRDVWLLGLYLFMISALLAVSLIDAELFIIPLVIPWTMAAVGVIVHTLFGGPGRAGSVMPGFPVAWMTIGATIGLTISILLLRAGLLKRSFADGEPMLDHERQQIADGHPPGQEIGVELKDYSRPQIVREMRHEMIFLIPPMLLAAVGGYLSLRIPAMAQLDAELISHRFVGPMLGSMLGAFVGAIWVWMTRILGSVAFGKEAMGMGDVHLMFGVGAIIGAGPVSVAYFLAPLMGLPIAIFLLIFARQRQIPYGPYLAAGSAAVIFLYTPIADYLRPGLLGLAEIIRGRLL